MKIDNRSDCDRMKLDDVHNNNSDNNNNNFNLISVAYFNVFSA